MCTDSLVVLYYTVCSTELLVVGNQWYWVYTTGDTSLYLYAVREATLGIGDVRLVATTQCVHASTNTSIASLVITLNTLQLAASHTTHTTHY